MTRIHKACKAYPAWKKGHSSRNFKPWLNPEQITLPRLNSADICSIEELQSCEVIDETAISDNDLDSDN